MIQMYLIALLFVSGASPSCVLLRTKSSECMLVTSLETNAPCDPVIEKLGQCLEKEATVVADDLPNSCNGDQRILRGLNFYGITHYGPSILTICNCNRSTDEAICDGSIRNEPAAASPKLDSPCATTSLPCISEGNDGNVGMVVMAIVIAVVVLILLAVGYVFLRKRKILKWTGSSNQPTVEEPVTATKLSKLYEEIDLSEPNTPSTMSTFKNPDDEYATVSKIRSPARNIDKTATPNDDDDDYSFASQPEDKSPAHNIDETATPNKIHDTSDSEQLSEADNTDKALPQEKKNDLYNI